MRGFLALLAIWALGGEASAQTLGRPATVATAEAEVRSGPSLDPKIYPTNKLHAGQQVEVLDQKEDWVAIKPPPGSFSWINRAKVEPLGTQGVNFVVSGPAGTKVPVLIGSAVNGSQRPTVESISLPRGAQVRATGGPLKDAEGEWLPIEPPEGEKRWMRRDTLSGLPALPTGNLVGGGVKGPAPGYLVSGLAQPKPMVATPVLGQPPAARWNQAVQAEGLGQPLEALRIYTEMTQEYAINFPDWARAATNRAQVLRNQGFALTAPLTPTLTASTAQGQPNCAPYPAAQPGVALVPVPNGGMTAAPAVGGQAPGALMSRNPQNGFPKLQGYLRRSGRSLNNKPMYMLETPEGRPISYILPTTSIALDPWIDHRVEVSGGTYYYGELRAEVLYVQGIRMVAQ